MATSDLTTTASVREYLNISSGQTDLNTLIASLITQCSAQIQRYCGRTFAPQTASLAKKFRYYGGGYLYFSPWDLDSTVAPTVQIDTDTSGPSTLTVNDDYFLLPLNADDGVYTHMELRTQAAPLRTSSTGYSPSRELTITAVWGFDSVPSDVALACNVLVGWVLRQHSTMPSGEFGGETERGGSLPAMPSSVRALLNPWRVMAFGAR